MQVTPYLHFSGDCEEAMNFYATALNGSIEALNRFGGSPMEAHVGDDYKQKIMHATVVAGDLKLMASDAIPGHEPAAGNAQVSLSLATSDGAEAERTFEALAAGGEITMPLQEVFWGGKFGMLKDRFGTHWLMSTP